MVIAETDRLILRELNPDDAAVMCELNADPRVMRNMPAPEDNSIEAERGRLSRYIARAYGTDGFGLWATILHETGEIIGRCGLLRRSVEGADEIEISYSIAHAHWGRGLATGAAAAIRDVAFENLGIPRLIAIVPADNPASPRRPA